MKYKDCLRTNLKSRAVAILEYTFAAIVYVYIHVCLNVCICMYTRHTISKFYALFIDFRDAFGSLNQSYLIRALLDANVNEEYCLIIADIYEESHFQVISQSEVSEEFLLTAGAKTGCPLSSLLFIISLD